MIDDLKVRETFEDLVNDRVSLYGTRNTIAYLLYRGFTKAELLELDFEDFDIKYVKANPDEDYDNC